VTQLRMGPAEWVLIGILSVLWGGSFLFVELALAALGPFTVVAVRVSLAALTLLAWLRIAGLRLPRDPQTWRAFLVMGLLNNALPFGLITWGQGHIEAGLAAILNATTPFFTILVAHALTRDERLSPRKGIGIAIGFAGVVAMIGPEALGGLTGSTLGQLAVVGAAVSYAFAGVFGRRFSGLPSAVAACGMLCASSLIMLPLALAVEGAPAALPEPGILVALVALAVLSTAAAYLIYFRVLARAGATNLLLVALLIPPGAVLMGWAVLDERLTAGAALGMAAILLGLAVVDGRLVKLCIALRRARPGFRTP
jgi:drug/metabolite transporter (DMT)-like permease